MSVATVRTVPGGAAATLVVGPDDTAEALGSGDVPVLGTPRLVALMELAARTAAAVDLPDASTTVGASISVEHLAPSRVGASVTATATIQKRGERRLDFAVEARDDETGAVLGRGTHRRVVVNRASFVEKFSS
jgi:fluoroacetyl-CoA thioesterase